MRFERVRPLHRFLGLVIGFVGVMILWHGDRGSTALAWGAGLGLTGCAMAFARAGHLVDFQAQKVISYFGWVVPWSREQRPFSSLKRVSVEGRRRSRNSIGGVYEFPVELRGEGPDVPLCEPRAYAKARRLARQLAHKMGLALSDHGVERASGFVDEPLRDRLLRTGAVPGQETPSADPSDPYRNVLIERKAPPAPAGTRITVEETDGETRIVVPARFRLSWILAFAGLALLIGGLPLMSQGGGAFAVRWAAIFWGGAAIAAWLCVATSIAPSRITISSTGLRVGPGQVVGGFWFPMMEVDDVQVASAEEPRYHNLTNRLDYPKGWPFVVVRSDKRAVAVGVGSSQEELAWLVARIQHAMARHSTEARARV